MTLKEAANKLDFGMHGATGFDGDVGNMVDALHGQAEAWWFNDSTTDAESRAARIWHIHSDADRLYHAERLTDEHRLATQVAS